MVNMQNVVTKTPKMYLCGTTNVLFWWLSPSKTGYVCVYEYRVGRKLCMRVTSDWHEDTLCQYHNNRLICVAENTNCNVAIS